MPSSSRATEYRGKTRGVHRPFYVWRQSLVLAVVAALLLCLAGIAYLLLFTHPHSDGNLPAFYALTGFGSFFGLLVGWLCAPTAGRAVPSPSRGLLALHPTGPSGVYRNHDQPVSGSNGQAGSSGGPVDSGRHRRRRGRADVARDEGGVNNHRPQVCAPAGTVCRACGLLRRGARPAGSGR